MPKLKAEVSPQVHPPCNSKAPTLLPACDKMESKASVEAFRVYYHVQRLCKNNDVWAIWLKNITSINTGTR